MPFWYSTSCTGGGGGGTEYFGAPVADYSSLPVTTLVGETHIAMDTGIAWWWNGTDWVPVSAELANDFITTADVILGAPVFAGDLILTLSPLPKDVDQVFVTVETNTYHTPDITVNGVNGEVRWNRTDFELSPGFEVRAKYLADL